MLRLRSDEKSFTTDSVFSSLSDLKRRMVEVERTVRRHDDALSQVKTQLDQYENDQKTTNSSCSDRLSTLEKGYGEVSVKVSTMRGEVERERKDDLDSLSSVIRDLAQDHSQVTSSLQRLQSQFENSLSGLSSRLDSSFSSLTSLQKRVATCEASNSVDETLLKSLQANYEEIETRVEALSVRVPSSDVFVLPEKNTKAIEIIDKELRKLKARFTTLLRTSNDQREREREETDRERDERTPHHVSSPSRRDHSLPRQYDEDSFVASILGT